MVQDRQSSAPLLALTAAVAAIAVAAIAAVLAARSDYEDRLASAYEVEAGGARLLAAGLAEEATLRSRGRRAPGIRRRAAADFSAEARRLRALAEGDPETERLVARRIAAQRRARAAARAGPALPGEGELTIAALEARSASRDLTDRQRLRRLQARADVREDTRAYLVIAVGAGIVSVAIALLVARRG